MKSMIPNGLKRVAIRSVRIAVIHDERRAAMTRDPRRDLIGETLAVKTSLKDFV